MADKLRKLIAAVLLFVLLQTFSVGPVQGAGLYLSPSSGPSGTSVMLTGSGFSVNETAIQVTYDSVTVVSSVTANSAGSFTTVFTVPSSPGGPHTVHAGGPFSSGVDTIFTVTSSILLGKNAGAAGSTISVSGTGFMSVESGIAVLFDGTPVAQNLSADSQGNWTSSFQVPFASAGEHLIRASGSQSASTRDIVFIVTAGVIISATSGSPGNSIALSGSGFATNEGGIVVNFDGIPVVPNISADNRGSWKTSVVVPAATSGPHTLRTVGFTTTSVPDMVFIVTPGIQLFPDRGVTGSTVKVIGGGFSGRENGISVNYEGAVMNSGITANSDGSWSATFVVPASTFGTHTVRSGGTFSSAVSADFSVIASVSGALNGAPGASVSLTGSGFSNNEGGINIFFDSAQIASGVKANAQGSWNIKLVIPPATGGQHTLRADGPVTPVIPEMSFAVIPGILMIQTSGTPGTPVAVTGGGYGASETDISLLFDGAVVVSSIRANPQGSWTANFALPPSAAGLHAITTAGSERSVAAAFEFAFKIVPGLYLSQEKGFAGNSIVVSGYGFGAEENNIVVTYDGVTVLSGIKASNQGSWTASLAIPRSKFGGHDIGSRGSVSSAGVVPDVNFFISPSVSLMPDAGNVGSIVELTGSGYSPNSPLQVNYDSQDVSPAGVAADATGSFEITIVIPQSKSGLHSVKVADAMRYVARTSFTMDSVAPPIPALIAPEDGTRIGLLGDNSPTFRWSTVNDPSGVTYSLQIDDRSDFPDPIIDISGLTVSHYSLNSSQSLPLGEYYWRVKAIDGASNESPWSETRELKSGLLAMWGLVLIILGGLGVSGGFAYHALVRVPRRRSPAPALFGASQPGLALPAPAPQRRRLEAPQAPRLALPERLGLPEPTGAVPAISSEHMGRILMVADFARSLPLVQAGNAVKWISDIAASAAGAAPPPELYVQLLNGQLKLQYQPAWINHPIYQDMVSLLEGQAIIKEINEYIVSTNGCLTAASQLLQKIYVDVREQTTELSENAFWPFVSAVYADALAWFMGKSLISPSERDYCIKTIMEHSDNLGLFGETPVFSELLLEVVDGADGFSMRDLHLKLRRLYRNNPETMKLAGQLSQLEVRRANLVETLSKMEKSLASIIGDGSMQESPVYAKKLRKGKNKSLQE